MTQNGFQPTSKNEMATKSVAKWHANKTSMSKIIAAAFIAKERPSQYEFNKLKKFLTPKKNNSQATVAFFFIIFAGLCPKMKSFVITTFSMSF